MKAPENFNPAKFLEEMVSSSPLVEQYFCPEELDLLGSIDDMYTKLDIENEVVPITVLELLERG
jgi:hypothetical protein